MNRFARMMNGTGGLNQILRLSIFALAVMAVFATTGCTRRILHISSSPRGAQLYVNDVYRGRTPVEVPFNWNWFYEIRLEAPGHETLSIRERLYAPPRHWIGPDLIAELVPWGSREDHHRHYRLNPLQQP
jgi:hypothetical protein